MVFERDPLGVPDWLARWASARGELATQRCHPQRRLGGVATLVALAPARARERLLHRRARQHAERARDARVELHAHHAAGRLRADEVVVVGLAADHRAKADDAGVATRGRRIARAERELERAG